MSGNWSSVIALARHRTGHSATLLQDGRVLIAGGGRLARAEGACDENNPGSLCSAELFDPVTATSSLTTDMFAAREGHQATLLADGGVLVAGGFLDIV